jgi:hypothetical protein
MNAQYSSENAMRVLTRRCYCCSHQGRRHKVGKVALSRAWEASSLRRGQRTCALAELQRRTTVTNINTPVRLDGVIAAENGLMAPLPTRPRTPRCVSSLSLRYARWHIPRGRWREAPRALQGDIATRASPCRPFRDSFEDADTPVLSRSSLYHICSGMY